MAFGDVHVVTQQLLQVDVARRGRLSPPRRGFLRPCFSIVGVLHLVVDGVQGVEPVRLLGAVLSVDAQPVPVRRPCCSSATRDQDVVLLPRLPVVRSSCALRMAMLWAPRCVAKVDTVQVARIIRIVPLSTLSLKQADRLAVGRVAQDDVVADHHGRRASPPRGPLLKPEDHGPLVGRESEGLLRETMAATNFARRDQHDHNRPPLRGSPSRGRRPGSRSACPRRSGRRG